MALHRTDSGYLPDQAQSCFVTTAEALTYYSRQIRTHPQHGAYIPLPVLSEISARPDREVVYEWVFGIIDIRNEPLRASYPSGWSD